MMNRVRIFGVAIVLVLLSSLTALGQEQTTGSIKGKVRVKGEGLTSGIAVLIRQGEREVARGVTGGKGEFQISGLAPGVYGVMFRKPGLSVGSLEDIQVRAGKTTTIPDGVVLTKSEADIAKLWSSVFNEAGRSVPGVKVEIALLEADGKTKKMENRITNETGQVVFRLSPDKATYRITVKADGAQPQTKDVEIDGPAVYRIAFTLQRSPQ